MVEEGRDRGGEEGGKRGKSMVSVRHACQVVKKK